jgi:regulation of enolase protein 1 (concanavalin A-like superfamily)
MKVMTLYRRMLLSGIVLLILTSLPFISLSYASSEMWSHTYGGPNNDSATAMIQTSDGGYALLGTAEGQDWLVKTDPFGNMEWNQTISFGESNRLTSLVETSDGGYALAGYRDSVTNNVVSSGAGLTDFWLVKTDEYGQVEWTKTYGGSLRDSASALVETSDGGLALAGYTLSFEPNGFWLVKTDKSGNMIWNQTYGGDAARVLVETSDKGFALAGTAWVGPGNCWLVKTDEYGKKKWSQIYGEEDEYTDYVHSLIETSDGGYALTGVSTTGYDYPVYSWFIKTDMYGNKEWAQKYIEGEFFSVAEASDNGFALAGFKTSPDAESRDFWLVRTDALGNTEWNQTYGGAAYDSATSLVAEPDGGFVLAGSTESFGAGSTDLWLVKTDKYGVVPEFPAWAILPLLTIALLFAIIIKKKGFRHHKHALLN